ncbi:MAG: hypothetical protein GY832_04785 [Chloroflexi bacterium]|nr:hypothetical protein [Chloroflexota bacterium]
MPKFIASSASVALRQPLLLIPRITPVSGERVTPPIAHDRAMHVQIGARLEMTIKAVVEQLAKADSADGRIGQAGCLAVWLARECCQA